MGMSRGAAAVLLALAATGPARAADGDFSCRNEAAEIQCSGAGCSVNSDSFTPMQVMRHGAMLEVCAYSGCGSGRLDLIRTRGSLTLLHAVLDGGPVQGEAAVVYDREARIATMIWGAFAQPLSCGSGG